MRIRVFLTSTLIFALLALGQSLALAHGDTSVAVQPLTPKPDEAITVKGEALGSHSKVEVLLIGNGKTVDLGEVEANEEGDFTTEFRIPADLAPGTYQVKATGEESATTRITVEKALAGGTDSQAGAMEEQAPILRQRPLGQSIGLVALFGVLAALGLLFARTVRPGA